MHLVKKELKDGHSQITFPNRQADGALVVTMVFYASGKLVIYLGGAVFYTVKMQLTVMENGIDYDNPADELSYVISAEQYHFSISAAVYAELICLPEFSDCAG
ncbi:hypothetical protein [Shewanella surugensis]|uniref:Uncharacterized protein n=1 Tax=Shewanella surugensis TaxID=212020 RepID=A0ABT0L6V9_9GAMM|nr:hypothetical protein [Shewanella surugensis]MCL1123437.1 hypothetical protein [Shewanella surugensis]